MTANAKPSWMPSEDRLREVAQNKCEDEEIRVEYLIRVMEHLIAASTRAAVIAEMERLHKIGWTYGSHTARCHLKMNGYNGSAFGDKCSCGFSEAMAGVDERLAQLRAEQGNEQTGEGDNG